MSVAVLLSTATESSSRAASACALDSWYMASFRACTPLAWGLASHPAWLNTIPSNSIAYSSGIRVRTLQWRAGILGIIHMMWHARDCTQIQSCPVQKRKQARDPAAQINGSLYKGVRDAGQERESTLEVVCRLVYMLLIQTRRLPEECCHEQDDHAAPLGSRRRHPRYQQLPTSCGPPSRATSSAPRSRLKPWESCGRHKPVNGGSIRGVTGGVKISCGHVTRLH